MIIALAYMATGFVLASILSVFPIRDEDNPDVEFVGDSFTFLVVFIAWPLLLMHLTTEAMVFGLHMARRTNGFRDRAIHPSPEELAATPVESPRIF